jgi:hypothetical protein
MIAITIFMMSSPIGSCLRTSPIFYRVRADTGEREDTAASTLSKAVPKRGEQASACGAAKKTKIYHPKGESGQSRGSFRKQRRFSAQILGALHFAGQDL